MMQQPVNVRKNQLRHTVEVWGRAYTFGANGLPESLITDGRELLAAPMRLVGTEDGEEIRWDDNYPENESEAFLQSQSEDEAVLCAAMQSERFLIDCLFRVERDGLCTAELKLAPRGLTVQECLGYTAIKPRRYALDRLWLEIPLRLEGMTHYCMYPNGPMYLADGTQRPEAPDTDAGALGEQAAHLPFQALLWLGNENRGFGFFAESDRNWKPAEENRAIELVPDRESGTFLLRLHLTDGQPELWQGDPATGKDRFQPVVWRFGFQLTPVKPFPADPYLIHGLHIDCGIKIKGNYRDFFAAGNRYDRLAEKGVDTLILHEKWNKSQNFPSLSVPCREQTREIVAECHKRGIRVLTYFGYEISMMAQSYADRAEEVRNEYFGGQTGGWWRVPYQRDYMVCYNSRYADVFVNGIAQVMDELGTDGVYLDGTIRPSFCTNERHGCGWRDADGTLHGTYPVLAVRDTIARLAKEVHARGGIVDVHSYGCMNFTALPYVDLLWYGENLQAGFIKGQLGDMNLGYFRAEYCGRNMGVPVELIAYENRPVWCFENAVAMGCIHGVLPRPNDIGHPLDVMSPIWKHMRAFPIAQSRWMPYWENEVQVSDDRVKVSYWQYTDPVGDVSLLAFCANTTREPAEVSVRFPELPKAGYDLTDGGSVPAALRLEGYGWKLLYFK